MIAVSKKKCLSELRHHNGAWFGTRIENIPSVIDKCFFLFA